MGRPAPAFSGSLTCSSLASIIAQLPGMTGGLVLNPIAATSGRGVTTWR